MLSANLQVDLESLCSTVELDRMGLQETSNAPMPYRFQTASRLGWRVEMLRSLGTLIVIGGLAGSAFAGEAEVKAAQGVVESQLKAMKAGDSVAAYSFASPTIQKMFPTPEAFMAMVTTAYQPVRNPQSFSFGKSEETSATTVSQQVMLVGPDGKNYEALYTLERQPDGTFKITGCSLKASNSLTT